MHVTTVCQMRELGRRVGRTLEWGDIVVDGLVSVGLTHGVEEPSVDTLRAIINARATVIGIPSGTDGDTERIHGTVVKADTTVPFGPPELANVLDPGTAIGGRLYLSHISSPPTLVQNAGLRVTLNEPLPLRGHRDPSSPTVRSNTRRRGRGDARGRPGTSDPDRAAGRTGVHRPHRFALGGRRPRGDQPAGRERGARPQAPARGCVAPRRLCGGGGGRSRCASRGHDLANGPRHRRSALRGGTNGGERRRAGPARAAWDCEGTLIHARVLLTCEAVEGRLSLLMEACSRDRGRRSIRPGNTRRHGHSYL